MLSGVGSQQSLELEGRHRPPIWCEPTGPPKTWYCRGLNLFPTTCSTIYLECISQADTGNSGAHCSIVVCDSEHRALCGRASVSSAWLLKKLRKYGHRHKSSLASPPKKSVIHNSRSIFTHIYLESQVAQNNKALYPQVDHKGARVAQNYWPLAFRIVAELLGDHQKANMSASRSIRAFVQAPGPNMLHDHDLRHYKLWNSKVPTRHRL